MARMIDPAELVDAREVARLLRVTHANTVSTYLRRYTDFPRPVVDLGQFRTRLWVRSDVRAWVSDREPVLEGGDDEGPTEEPASPNAAPSRPAAPSLPTAADAFIGRGQDLADVAQAMNRARLVSITGPSGVGKTRLAREVGGRVEDGHYPHGVHFVELAAVREARLVPGAVARALSVWEQPSRPVLDTLTSHLRRRHLLLILDNCEHVIDECARVADALLGNCPKVSILATSQVPLGIGGEEVWQLAPLTVPEAGSASDLLAASDAVSLFSLRAAATGAGFSLTPELIPVVAEICRRLDGIPLAVELAAARVAVLTPQEILARLDNRFALLTGGSRAVLPRHQTLQAAFDWSHDLLSPQEEVLLRRLSVFAGGCTLEAVEAVCAEPGRSGEVLASLAGLVAKSLVLARTSGAQARYRMLETIRLYGAERLAGSGETADLQRRHALWCLAFAEKAEPALTGEDQVSWLDRLEEEYDNLRAALAWAVAEGESDLALRLAGALTIFWRVHCHFREAREWLSAALALEGNGTTASRTKALWGMGFMELMVLRESAPVTLEESLVLAREHGDVQGEARALLLLGNYAWINSDWEAAVQNLEQSAERARESEDGWCLAHALALWGRTHLSRGDVRAARVLLEEGVQVARRRQDMQGLRLGLGFLGELVLAAGEYSQAETIFSEALDVSRGLGEPFAVAFNLAQLGRLATVRGEFGRAHVLLQSALEIDREGDSAPPLIAVLAQLGWLEHAQGRLAAALPYFEESRSLAGEAGFPPLSALHGVGELALAEGRWSDSGMLFDEVRSRLAPECRSERAGVTASLGRLARARGDLRRATTLCAEALAIRKGCREAPSMTASVEEMAALAAEAGQHERAARLFGAAQAIRDDKGYARPPVLRAGHQADLAVLRKGLGSPRLQELLSEGAAMSLGEVVAYALKGRYARGRATTGWSALTRSERDITALVAKGLTNNQIGERLFVSPRTVETHLTSVFSKVGLSSRRELAKAVVERGM